ncbi:MAG: 2-C-methyl-D-erythritol 4-phosphate cytidylyltransferase [Bacteroidia bacterium]|nr:2-C-methyl-D-erythritol 4-phosphate cytidylyltransferase [Bacteroidia bacterium]MDW8301891.1 2-C-methyl-D-erythritol 4-phosphate cytidylyltransferase [Bacteroidia bacterium]
MNKYAIIVAGGLGTRLQADRPKQFLEIANKPILIHTLFRFLQAVPDIKKIVVVTHLDWMEYTQQIIQRHVANFECIEVIAGGKTRFESVRNGLKHLSSLPNGYVAVHDAVRCCIKIQDIRQAFEVAQQKNNCVVCTTLKESIRKIVSSGTEAVPRDKYLVVQTPQIFLLQDMLNVYLQQIEIEPQYITDDASLMEQYGHQIFTILIADHNIKITTPQDLYLAEYLLRNSCS